MSTWLRSRRNPADRSDGESLRNHRRLIAVFVCAAVLLTAVSISPPKAVETARQAAQSRLSTLANSAQEHLPFVPTFSSSSSASAQWQPTCSASDWSAGRWVSRNLALSPNASIWDVSPTLGTGGHCAQDFIRVQWYLGTVSPEEAEAAATAAEAAARRTRERRSGEESVEEAPVNVVASELVDAERPDESAWAPSDYRMRAGNWRWEPESEACRTGVEDLWEARAEGEAVDEGTVQLLQDLVDRGGWLIVGDSLSEEHFFSLSCMLFPHVKGNWPYPFMTRNEWQFKEEHLLLDASSPLIHSGRLRVPEQWDYEGSPLISHVRSDHGFDAEEILRLYTTVTSPSRPAAFSTLYPTLTSLVPHDEPIQLFSPSSIPLSATLEYIHSLFLRPSAPRNITTPLGTAYASNTTWPSVLEDAARVTRSAHYRALIFSTGPHFSARQFDFNLGASGAERAAELIDVVPTEFFELVMRSWLDRTRAALDSASEAERAGKEVLLRPTNVGHDFCHDAPGPDEEEDRSKSTSFYWNQLWDMSAAAERFVHEMAHPQIHFVDTNRPTALRPDGHTNYDCLHLAVGTGVIESWTRYFAYWLHERGEWLDQQAQHGSWW
ncbi:hypothetical protein Rhopal_007711-T1 [Rhodotorula paludigena]|uniref:Proteophosphoglycan ppg4 n=1 Tax=Rhodotorula paludigena TaxID=86838 RepID=A0AAV5H1M6_9BASI|nr:hypothetical protein Rhopal_007711-T1 [Rhodotorula paludigena]